MKHVHDENGNVTVSTVEVKGVWWRVTTTHCSCGVVRRSSRERV